MSYFNSKHAVVTGGGSGIGAEIAASLVDAGATVTIMGRSEDKLRAVADSIGAARETADVTDRDQVATAFASAVDRSGNVEILVNNGGHADLFARDDRGGRFCAVHHHCNCGREYIRDNHQQC